MIPKANFSQRQYLGSDIVNIDIADLCDIQRHDNYEANRSFAAYAKLHFDVFFKSFYLDNQHGQKFKLNIFQYTNCRKIF